MNVTATTTVTMIIQQPSLTEGITAIMAFAAVIVSGLTLWFTSLKGSNIVLLERPLFIQKTIQRETFDRIIPDIVFETNLIFLNNGTASGVLRMDARFEPMNELAPFFKKDRFMFGTEFHRYTASASMPPISIDEKDSAVIYIELTVEFHDWKRYFVREPVPKEQISEVLCQADSKNKKRFSDFCAILKNGMHIGTVSIKSYQTARKKTEERILVGSKHIGVLDEELISNFRSWETRWDTIDPHAILMDVQQVRESLEKELHECLMENFKTLMGLPEIGPLRTDLLDTVRRRFDGYESKKAIAEFVLRSANLDSVLSKYDLRTRDWNRRLNLLKEDPSKKTLEQSLIAEKDSLKTETASLVAEVTNLLNTLRECYSSNP